MPLRLVALDEGPDITIDRPMVIVGRHPQCDARLDSIRVSRRHCCMTHTDNNALFVRDLGSTNGIRINGQRVEEGRIEVGDELAIAHIRFRLDDGSADQSTLAGSIRDSAPVHHPPSPADPAPSPAPAPSPPSASGLPSWNLPLGSTDENPLAAAVRHLLPPEVAERCKIQVIVQMSPEAEPVAAASESSANSNRCQPDSSL
ncbi:MAG: hypothetical protein KatS3mg108_0411 [Isosphaeraceae bacterium]|nr:MAG: hypothetical protein KatS3mg108_0411 [Isosphaeraceae bacterium]